MAGNSQLGCGAGAGYRTWQVGPDPFQNLLQSLLRRKGGQLGPREVELAVGSGEERLPRSGALERRGTGSCRPSKGVLYLGCIK